MLLRSDQLRISSRTCGQITTSLPGTSQLPPSCLLAPRATAGTAPDRFRTASARLVPCRRHSQRPPQHGDLRWPNRFPPPCRVGSRFYSAESPPHSGICQSILTYIFQNVTVNVHIRLNFDAGNSHQNTSRLSRMTSLSPASRSYGSATSPRRRCCTSSTRRMGTASSLVS